ncbi:unnamed protein product [Bursaphelenchus okinawaensis]|uniref:Uncharacterized protein n=1 Tax=Bursaphelenchus okinawaensis TaxID=465554 RepID=A0A811KBS0_9BILA|nr:unnamed protein product [Bursaphelenchus okinawaensis]CAG9097225.1 unnamed protein product [Bursaphelenchus okinawaensis]
MKSFVIFFTVAICCSYAGELTIVNQCTDPVTVVKTVPGGAQTTQCQLAVGESCVQNYTTGVMNFRHNYGSGHTIAEFSFGNSDGNDNYDLNVIEGFDIGMQIIPEDGGHVAECATANCTDAYHSSSDNHTYGVPSGSPFTLNLCQFDNVDSSSAVSAPATTLTINNQCTDPVTVVKTVTGGAQTVQCQLAVGESCSQTYTTGVMNFRHNYGSGHTIAEFSFGNSNGNSNYDLNVIEGFDIGMQIIPEDGGHVAECATADCTDAYHSSSDNHTYGVPAGNPFTLNLCQFDAVSGTTTSA